MNQWQTVDEVGALGHDFNAHFAFYDSVRLLSFIWDGQSEYITVAYGGYGEYPEWVIPAIVARGTAGQVIEAFEQHCVGAIPEWDERFWNDNDYTYHEPIVSCARMDKVIPVPSGRPYYGTKRDEDGKYMGSERRIAE